MGFPEFIAKSKKFILVVEDKASVEHQAHYANEEQTTLATDTKSIIGYAENGALHYAQHIVAKTNFKKVFAFGCSGNETHHIIRPIYVDENGYKLLDKIDNFNNFAPENIAQFYKEQVLGETPPEILETEQLLKKASDLHEALRNYGQLGDKEKPLVVSAILLALQDKGFRIDLLMGDDIDIDSDGSKIYKAIENYFKRVKVEPAVKKDKVLHQFNIVTDRTLLSETHKRLGKTPLRYFTEFIENNILNSIKANAKEDILWRWRWANTGGRAYA